MQNKIIKGTILFFILSLSNFVISSHLFSCTYQLVGEWEYFESTTTELNRIKPKGTKAAQGIDKFKISQYDQIVLTNGYGFFNATILSTTGKVLKSKKLSTDSSTPLLADVTFDGKSLWWTDYHGDKIYQTNLSLDIENIINLEFDSALVGITFIKSKSILAFPIRNQPFIGIIYPNNKLFSSLVGYKRFEKDDLYDIKYIDDCLFLVGRVSGKIYFAPINQDTDMNKLEWTEFVSGLDRPQHIDEHNGIIFILETNRNSITALDYQKKQITRFIFEEPRVYRGLVMIDSNYALATGFFDERESQNENNTGISEFFLNWEYRQPFNN